MVHRDKRVKYTAVLDEVGEHELTETVDFEPMKSRLLSRACLWQSSFTALLIIAYYIPSIGLTFYQRWLYQSFHFPLLTVLVHMTVKFILAMLIRSFMWKKYKQHVSLGWKEYIVGVGPTGVFSGIDISFSNWGLELVTVSLYTMTKSTTIIFILFFSILFNLEKKSWSLCGIVGTISLGLVLFTYKSTQFNMAGFSLLIAASVASGARWTYIQLLLQKSKMGMENPVDMIYYMQPLMLASVLPIFVYMEGADVLRSCQLFGYTDTSQFIHLCVKVLVGAIIAFAMEFGEVTLVTYTSSLTLAIAGIFKEALMLALAVAWQGDRLSALNCLGLTLCLAGIVGHVVHKIKSGSLTRGRHSNVVQRGQRLLDQVDSSDASDGEENSDTQVLFDILARDKRYQ